MALTPRSGFSNTTSGQNDIPNEIPNTQSDVLNNMPFVTDTNLNKYAIDSGAYPNTTKMLVGFIKGKRISVTYYRLLRQGGTNLRTNIADYPTTSGVLNTEYQKIINLEITLPKGFEFEVNNANASVGVTGEAMFYPNMNPNVGDIFTTGLGDGRIGVFQISSVTPMSWRQDRIYTVQFILQSFMSSEDSDPIEGSVTITSVFSKENYLGGTAALLSEQSYLQLQKLKGVRGVLCKYYHQTFWLNDLGSWSRPDGIYDPWAVYFMANKLTMDDIHVRPKNLLGNRPKEYKKTLWGRLDDRYNNTLYGLSPQFYLVGTRQTRMSSFVTELYGRSIVTPAGELSDIHLLVDGANAPILNSQGKVQYVFDDENPYDTYVFSTNFYAGSVATMSSFELRIYNAIKDRTAGDLTTLISDFIDPVYSLNDEDQYYRIPLYIHLIDMALQSQYREIDAPSMSYGSTGE